MPLIGHNTARITAMAYEGTLIRTRKKMDRMRAVIKGGHGSGRVGACQTALFLFARQNHSKTERG